MERINFIHSTVFFNFCILISPFYFMLKFEPVILCLFLILVLGISHGALDNIKGKKLLKLLGYKSVLSFYVSYILISITIIVLWLIFPNTVLFIFLVVAAYHFGKEDTVFSFKKKMSGGRKSGNAEDIKKHSFRKTKVKLKRETSPHNYRNITHQLPTIQHGECSGREERGMFKKVEKKWKMSGFSKGGKKLKNWKNKWKGKH